MQGAIQAIRSRGNVLRSAVLQHVRILNPALQPAIFSRSESASSSQLEEHGFESTTVSDVLKSKGKSADGSWLWCTTDDSVYDAVKSVCILLLSTSAYWMLAIYLWRNRTITYLYKNSLLEYGGLQFFLVMLLTCLMVCQMTQHNVGALVVVKPGEEKAIAGIITERGNRKYNCF